jgi:hypothetical protein
MPACGGGCVGKSKLSNLGGGPGYTVVKAQSVADENGVRGEYLAT